MHLTFLQHGRKKSATGFCWGGTGPGPPCRSWQSLADAAPRRPRAERMIHVREPAMARSMSLASSLSRAGSSRLSIVDQLSTSLSHAATGHRTSVRGGGSGRAFTHYRQISEHHAQYFESSRRKMRQRRSRQLERAGPGCRVRSPAARCASLLRDSIYESIRDCFSTS